MLLTNIATLKISKLIIEIRSKGDCQQIIPEAMYNKKKVKNNKKGGFLSFRSKKNNIATLKREIIVFIPPTKTFNTKNDKA